eukprot:g9273.t1
MQVVHYFGMFAPKWFLGMGWVFGRRIVQFLAKNAADLKKHGAADVQLGFWLAPLEGARPAEESEMTEMRRHEENRFVGGYLDERRRKHVASLAAQGAKTLSEAIEAREASLRACKHARLLLAFVRRRRWAVYALRDFCRRMERYCARVAATPQWWEKRAQESKGQVLVSAKVFLCTIASTSRMLREWEEAMGSQLHVHTVVVDECGCTPESSTALLLRLRPANLVLVGDHKQLPPTSMVQPQILEDGPPGTGHTRSLLERCVLASGRVHQLREQYRMHPRIAGLVSERFYAGPQEHRPLLWMDVQGREEAPNKSYLNRAEVSACVRVATRLRERIGMEPSVALLTFYKGRMPRGCFKENCSFCHVHHPLLVDHGRPRRAKREAIKLQIFEHFQVQDEDERQRLLQEEAAQHPFAWNFVKGLLDNPAFNEKCDFCHLVHEPKAEDLGRPRREKREAIKRAIFADFAVEDEDERHRLLQDAAAKHPFARNFIKGLLDNPAFHLEELMKAVPNDLDVEVLTVDACQGSEFDFVILTPGRNWSTVRANRELRLGFVKDAQRICVATSRSRLQLFVVGHRQTLSGDGDWRKVAEACTTPKPDEVQPQGALPERFVSVFDALRRAKEQEAEQKALQAMEEQSKGSKGRGKSTQREQSAVSYYGAGPSSEGDRPAGARCPRQADATARKFSGPGDSQENAALRCEGRILGVPEDVWMGTKRPSSGDETRMAKVMSLSTPVAGLPGSINTPVAGLPESTSEAPGSREELQVSRRASFDELKASRQASFDHTGSRSVKGSASPVSEKAEKTGLFVCWLCRRKFDTSEKFDLHRRAIRALCCTGRRSRKREKPLRTKEAGVPASVCYALCYFWRYPIFMLPPEILKAKTLHVLGRDLSLQECISMAFVLGFGAAKLPAMRLQTSNFFFRYRLGILLMMLFLSMALAALAGLLPIPILQVLCIFGSSFVSSFLYGGIVTYLEGRRSTEILLASISASLVFAGTVSRACAAELLHWGVPPRLMPLLLVSFLLAAFLLVETARAPPPSRADVAARSARTAMPPRRQWEFVRENLLGVVATIGIWACMAGLRSFRDFYTQQIFAAALKDDSPSSKVYVLADVPGAILSFISLVMMSWVSNNQRALFLMLLTNVSGHSVKGLFLMAACTYLFRHHELPGMAWILIYSAAFYAAYSVLNAPLNERIFAVTRAEGTCSFLIYASDFFGYVVTIGLLMILAIASIFYFSRSRYNRRPSAV